MIIHVVLFILSTLGCCVCIYGLTTKPITDNNYPLYIAGIFINFIGSMAGAVNLFLH